MYPCVTRVGVHADSLDAAGRVSPVRVRMFCVFMCVLVLAICGRWFDHTSRRLPSSCVLVFVVCQAYCHMYVLYTLQRTSHMIMSVMPSAPRFRNSSISCSCPRCVSQVWVMYKGVCKGEDFLVVALWRHTTWFTICNDISTVTWASWCARVSWSRENLCLAPSWKSGQDRACVEKGRLCESYSSLVVPLYEDEVIISYLGSSDRFISKGWI